MTNLHRLLELSWVTTAIRQLSMQSFCGLLLFCSTFGLTVSSNAQSDVPRIEEVGKYLNGAYNVRRDKLRFIAIKYTGSYDEQTAYSVVKRARKVVRKENITHERLWHGNYRTMTLRPGEVLVIAWYNEDENRHGFLATNGLDTYIRKDRPHIIGGSGWRREKWKTATKEIYLQFGFQPSNRTVHYQFGGVGTQDPY